ncbi:hypothetical protein Tco_1193690 [Tanacetum coccineum]
MRTRSQSRNSNRQQQQVNPTFVETFNLVEPIPVVTMDDNRTMAQLLEAPTVGYEGMRSWHGIRSPMDLLRYICPHHGFSELHQLDTFYNALNSNDQDSLNSAAGDSEQNYKSNDNLTDHAFQSSCIPIPLLLQFRDNLLSITITNPKWNVKNRIGDKDRCSTNKDSPKDVQPTVVQINLKVQILNRWLLPLSAHLPNFETVNPYPSRRNDEKRREKANDQVEKFYKIFQDMSFEISLADALILMPNLLDFKALIEKKEKLRTGRALIDVYERELTLRVGKEAVTFNLDQTSRYSSNYDDMTANRIDVIEMACEEYSKEVLGFYDVIVSAIPSLI